MSESEQQDLKQEAVPFFARYLEGQTNFIEDLSEEETEAVAGGLKAMTRKFPSDCEDGGGGIVTTLKFPSDNEEHGGGGVVTQKFPSDSDEGV